LLRIRRTVSKASSAVARRGPLLAALSVAFGGILGGWACGTEATPAAVADSGSDAFALGPPVDAPPEDAGVAILARYALRSCAGGPESFCHASGAAGLVLPSDGGNLVNVRSSERPDLFRVAPGDPPRSYLYLKVVGDGGIEGGRMPPTSGAPDEKLRALLERWIEAGAP
jgi:hypothetical protein